MKRSTNSFFLPFRIRNAAKLSAAAEERIDAMQADVTAYLVQITRKQLTEPQSELVPLLMHCTNDAERIADHTELILQLAARLIKNDKKLSRSREKRPPQNVGSPQRPGEERHRRPRQRQSGNG